MSRRQRVARALVPYLLVAAVGGLVAFLVRLSLVGALAGDRLALRNPWALSLLAGAALVMWVAFHLRLRRSPTFLFSRTRELGAVRPGWIGRLGSLPMALRVVSLALIAIALARPQTFRSQDLEIEGIDIMIVLDLSRSMEERDLASTRLDAGQRTIRRFLRRRVNDRVGLVVFAEEAMLQCPLTHDYRSLDRIVDGVQIGDVPDMGTAIGDGLGLALAQLRRSLVGSKVVILVSDGDSNIESELDPQVAKRIAMDMGVRVFTILMGQEDPRKDRAMYAVNPELLREIAADTGGLFFNAGDDRELERSFSTIRETLELTRHRVTGKIYGELFPHFLHLAVLLLVAEIAMTLTRWRRFP
jgi:Ca-activated chloride channel homolog